MNAASETSRHILLVDAERYVWDVVRHALGEGYRTSAVAFRSAALRILKQDPPDAIIVDLRPNAQGLALAIHGLGRRIPVVLTTGNHGLARRLSRLDCVALRKPFSPSELRRCIDLAVADPDGNLLRLRTAIQRVQTDAREREALLRQFGRMREEVILALKAAR